MAVETWQEVKDVFYPAFGDEEGVNNWITADQVSRFANKALWEIAEYTSPVDLEVVFNTAADTHGYTLNSTGHGTLKLWRMELDDEPLLPTTQAYLRSRDPNWKQLSGVPGFYYLDSPTGDPDAFTVHLWPTPETVIEARAILKVVPAAVSDSADDDYLQIPAWSIPGVIYSMLSDAYMTRGKKEDMEIGDFFRVMFEDVLERLKMRSNSRLPKSRSLGQNKRKLTGTWRDNLPDLIPEP